MRKHGTKPTPFGFQLKGHKSMQEGSFEPEETKLIQEYLKNAEVFVDVGANVGFFTCLARSMYKETIAVEPLTQNLRYLYANLQANGWTDVEVYPVGLSAHPGIATFYGGGTSASLLRKWAGMSEVWQRQIPLSTMDILLGDRFEGQRMMIKIDVEGAEYDVLRGAERTLAMSPPPVWLLEICLTEHHPGGIHPLFQDVFHIFWSRGYRARVADGDGRAVFPSDVERWVRNSKRDFGFINYIFEQTTI
jgi:FkbM family methyltransferase